jgi:hypothetical protein
MGKVIVAVGLAVVLVGVLVWLIEQASGSTLGRLPGDIHLQRGSFSFYFPIATCVALSLILTLVFALLFRRRSP